MAVVRAWVRVYTLGVPEDLRETRRTEMSSDLWEHASDARERGTPRAVAAMEMVLRALMGVPHDLSWRFEAIHMRHGGDLERRNAFMALSPRQIRWMGLAGVLGGVVWAGSLVVNVDAGTVVRGYGHIALSILFIVSLLAFYAQQGPRAHKAGRAGFVLLLAAFVAWLAVNVLGTVFGASDSGLTMNLLAGTWVFLQPPGFLLLGLGLKGAARGVPLAIGCAFTAWLVVPHSLYAHYFPSVTNWNRGDTPIGLTVFFLMGIGLALMGYTAYRSAVSVTKTAAQ
ncbi:MAG: hypothetical protein ACT4QD_17390 [Acidobacteriota bacterium]